jgi:hypothetical protein
MTACAGCRYCTGGGLPTRHGLCTDPDGSKGLCDCYIFSETHRAQHHLRLGDSYAEDAEHDGGLGSRRVVDRWEWEEERHLERTRG